MGKNGRLSDAAKLEGWKINSLGAYDRGQNRTWVSVRYSL